MKKKSIPVMYLGEKLTVFNTIQHEFRDKKGEIYSFNGIKGAHFGEVYPMNDEKLKTRLFGLSIEPKPFEPTEEDIVRFETRKLVVSEFRATKRKEMNLKRPHQDIIRAIDLLRKFYLSMSDHDRRLFMGYISNQCSKKKRKG